MSEDNRSFSCNYNFLLIIGLVSLIPLNLAFVGLIEAFALKLVLGIAGCFGLPLLALIIDEGINYNGNQTKYLIKLLVLAIVSAYPYFLCFNSEVFDPRDFFSLAFTGFIFLGSIIVIDKFKDNRIKILFIVTVFALTFFVIQSDFSIALIPGFLIHLYKKDFKRLAYYMISFALVFLVIGIIFYNINGADPSKGEYLHMISFSGSALSLPLIKKYDDTPCKKIKFIPYIVYPVILLILYSVKMIIALN